MKNETSVRTVPWGARSEPLNVEIVPGSPRAACIEAMLAQGFTHRVDTESNLLDVPTMRLVSHWWGQAAERYILPAGVAVKLADVPKLYDADGDELPRWVRDEWMNVRAVMDVFERGLEPAVGITEESRRVYRAEKAKVGMTPTEVVVPEWVQPEIVSGQGDTELCMTSEVRIVDGVRYRVWDQYHVTDESLATKLWIDPTGRLREMKAGDWVSTEHPTAPDADRRFWDDDTPSPPPMYQEDDGAEPPKRRKLVRRPAQSKKHPEHPSLRQPVVGGSGAGVFTPNRHPKRAPYS